MNIDQLRKRFPNEAACRHYFESIIWSQGRQCPHCGSNKSCRLNGVSVKTGTIVCFENINIAN